jgi:signal transduction histidine kinase
METSPLGPSPSQLSQRPARPGLEATFPRAPRSYRAFLASRWGPRTRLLAIYALWGSPVLLAFDIALCWGMTPSPGVAFAAAVRLPWMIVPAAGWLVMRRFGQAPWLGPLVVVLAVAWTWGNTWAYSVLGLHGSVLEALGLVLCFLTAANFLPLRMRARLGVFALMAAGKLFLDLTGSQVRPLSERLWADAAILGLVGVQTVVFEQYARSQRRRFILHRDLERKVTALERSRLRADRAATELGRLAARVAHDVNNPLAAVKVNASLLREQLEPGERAELVKDTLEAVDRIARGVMALEAPAVTPAPARVRAVERNGRA